MTNETQTSLPATDGGDELLLARVRTARDLALQRLGELQSPNGSWCLPIGSNAMIAATYMILLRTSGIIVKPGQFELEAKLLRETTRYANLDGGFWKFPASPSSKGVTLVCVTALRLTLGEVASGSRPASWYQRNPLLDAGFERELREVLRRSQQLLACGHAETPWEFEHELRVLAPLLASHADVEMPLPRVLRFGAWLAAVLSLLPGRAWLSCRFHFLLRTLWPALIILFAATQRRRQGVCRNGRRGLFRNHLQDRCVRDCAARIREAQDPSGAWALSSLITMLNLMALVEAGAPREDPAVERAHASLLHGFLIERDTSTRLAAARSDLGNTGYGLDSCLRALNSGNLSRSVRSAIELLRSFQTSQGGFAWDTTYRRDADADATAHVLRGFPQAAQLVEGELRSHILAALRRGVDFMLARQNRDGGFSCWSPTFVAGRRGSLGVLAQILFDMPTADVTGRIVEVLASVGYDTRHPAIRKALGFFLKTQCRNGGWWSRWWAGYLVGASFVLRAYAKLGLQYEPTPGTSDGLRARSRRALARAIAFLLDHQNSDGGWGETIRSDADIRYAGQGDSAPLHTAHVTSTLLRVGCPSESPVIRSAIEFLLRNMSPEGRWHDQQCTFTIFARSLYCRYEFLAYVLPLDALTDYLQARGSSSVDLNWICGPWGL